MKWHHPEVEDAVMKEAQRIRLREEGDPANKFKDSIAISFSLLFVLACIVFGLTYR